MIKKEAAPELIFGAASFFALQTRVLCSLTPWLVMFILRQELALPDLRL